LFNTFSNQEKSPSSGEFENVMTKDAVILSVGKARKLIFRALTGAGANPKNAAFLSDGVLDTELSGMAGHGLPWLAIYCDHLKSGKVDGKAKPRLRVLSSVAFKVDARGGLAHPAIELGFSRLVPAAQKYGIAALAVGNSYNAATLGFHTAWLARKGLVALGYTNTTPAIMPPGGSRKILGTNPMSLAIPGRKGNVPFLIDQSASAVAYTNITAAAERAEAIPAHWGYDANGLATTDPKAILEGGAIAPAGGYKGFNLALIVEVMCAGLGGGLLGVDQASFIDNDGRAVGCGQFFIAISPDRFGKADFHARMDRLIGLIADQPGTRLPNSRRGENQKRIAQNGIPVAPDLLNKLADFARGPNACDH
jgi:(2R)-3-sulfolactate dehydrogenase (NADP+)